MSDYPKIHVIVYVGRRLSTDRKILFSYEVLNPDMTRPSDPRTFCFSKRIKAAYGIGTIAKVTEAKENSFNVGQATYLDSVSNENGLTAGLRSLAAGWRAKDEAAAGVKELERKSKGEDVWFLEMRQIKQAYRFADRGARAIILAKLIQYLDAP